MSHQYLPTTKAGVHYLLGRVRNRQLSSLEAEQGEAIEAALSVFMFIITKVNVEPRL